MLKLSPKIALATMIAMNSAMAFANPTTSQQNSVKAIADVEQNLSAPLCAIHAVLTGPIVVAAIVLAVIIGGILKLVGNRNAMSIIWSALVAGVIIFLSGTIVGIVLGGRDARCDTSNSLTGTTGTKPNPTPKPNYVVQ